MNEKTYITFRLACGQVYLTLKCLLVAAVVVVAIQGALTLRSLEMAAKASTAEVHALRADLTAQVSRVVDGDPAGKTTEDRAPLRALLVGVVDKHATRIENKADGRLASIQKDVRGIGAAADARIGEALKLADSRLAGAQGSIDRLEVALLPTLANAASLTKDAQDSLDDLYPDIKGTVASATVAVTSAAYASEAVRDAAPAVAKSVIGVGKSADGIAADVKREADVMTRPKRWYEKILGPAYTVGRLVAAFL